MARRTSARFFLLGIDGLPPKTFDRFLGEGILPNCSRLASDSARLTVIPTLPPLTAPGWATIASGAHPATHGVLNILQPRANARPDEICNGFDRRLVKAEYLWEVLSEAGKQGIVVKYPSSWPPRGGHFLQVDGAGGYADISCQFECLTSGAYFCSRDKPMQSAVDFVAVPQGYKDHWRIDSGESQARMQIPAREPTGWSGVPPQGTPLFEAILPVQLRAQRLRHILHALVYALNGRHYLALARTKSLIDPIGVLTPGDWTDWIYESSNGKDFAYRLKLIGLDASACRFWLYRSEGHCLSGFTKPTELAEELHDAVGPMCEWTGTFDKLNGLIDLETQLQIYDQHTLWLENTIRHLSVKPWDGFFMQWHAVEYAHHIAGAALDAEHPLSHLNRDEYLDFLRGTYRLLDRLVGTVLDCVGTDDTIAFVSDHGHGLVHSLFFVNDLLREKGWLVTIPSMGGFEIDWSRTLAYATYPGCVFVNASSRWSGGVVENDNIVALCDVVEAALRTLIDDRTNRPVIDAVIRREAMAAFGQGGVGGPDLFFTMAEGYEVASRLRGHKYPLFELTRPGDQLTSGHGSFHPQSDAAKTLALLRSPLIDPGSRARNPVAITDLAPTFAEMMGIRRLRQADGRPLDFAELGVASKEHRR